MVSLHSHIKWKALAALDMSFISQWKNKMRNKQSNGEDLILYLNTTLLFSSGYERL